MLKQELVYCQIDKSQQPHMYEENCGFSDDHQPLCTYHCMNCGYSTTRLEHADKSYWSKAMFYNWLSQVMTQNVMMSEDYYDLACYYADLYLPSLKDDLKGHIYAR